MVAAASLIFESGAGVDALTSEDHREGVRAILDSAVDTLKAAHATLDRAHHTSRAERHAAADRERADQDAFNRRADAWLKLRSNLPPHLWARAKDHLDELRRLEATEASAYGAMLWAAMVETAPKESGQGSEAGPAGPPTGDGAAGTGSPVEPARTALFRHLGNTLVAVPVVDATEGAAPTPDATAGTGAAPAGGATNEGAAPGLDPEAARAARNAAVIEDRKAGLHTADIAAKYGLSQRRVEGIVAAARAAGERFTTLQGTGGGRNPAKRRANLEGAIIADRKAGANTKQISVKHRVSEARVLDVLNTARAAGETFPDTDAGDAGSRRRRASNAGSAPVPSLTERADAAPADPARKAGS